MVSAGHKLKHELNKGKASEICLVYKDEDEDEGEILFPVREFLRGEPY